MAERTDNLAPQIQTADEVFMQMSMHFASAQDQRLAARERLVHFQAADHALREAVDLSLQVVFSDRISGVMHADQFMQAVESTAVKMQQTWQQFSSQLVEKLPERMQHAFDMDWQWTPTGWLDMSPDAVSAPRPKLVRLHPDLTPQQQELVAQVNALRMHLSDLHQIKAGNELDQMVDDPAASFDI